MIFAFQDFHHSTQFQRIKHSMTGLRIISSAELPSLLINALLCHLDWRDVELMRDIEAATGENLGSDRVGKKGKGKKKKYPNLSDLKQSANTSRSRLEKKVFNKYVTSFFSMQLDD